MVTALKRVLISEADSCLSYALKRVGLYPYLNQDLSDFLNGFITEQCIDIKKDPQQDPQIGDLLLWSNEVAVWQPNEIDISGRVIDHYKEISYHFAVYESDGCVSDLVRDGIHNYIRVRHFYELPPPKSIFRMRKNYSNSYAATPKGGAVKGSVINPEGVILKEGEFAHEKIS